VRTTLGAFAPMPPRQKLTATPYAITAGSLSGTLPATQLGGTISDARLSANVSVLGASIESAEITDGTILNANISASAGIVDTKLATIATAGKVSNSALSASVSLMGQSIDTSEITDGTITAADVYPGSFNTTFWRVGGNGGTTDKRPLDLRVNNQLVLRLEPTAGAPNLTGGGSFNAVYAGTKGAIIAGGELNTITTFSDRSVIGGGYDNGIESCSSSVVAGGSANGIGTNSSNSVISGGNRNKVLASASFATIPGGLFNSATNYAFAAGRRAKANHTGAVVWADSTDADFASTAANHFRVRAGGGMDLVGGNAVETFKFAGSRSGGFGSPVAYGVNNNTTGSSAPVLRLVSNGGNSGDGVLSVSSQGTGDLARFGNASTFVAWLTTNGNWNALAFNPTSDRAAKENFAVVDPREVLDKVAALPLARWNYKAAPGLDHIGPVAQDFHTAFGLNGEDDKHIATVDADGVALAAIQGLNQKVETYRAELEERQTEVSELRRRNEELLRRLEILEQRLK
jgi:hypothetical protein